VATVYTFIMAWLLKLFCGIFLFTLNFKLFNYVTSTAKQLLKNFLKLCS